MIRIPDWYYLMDTTSRITVWKICGDNIPSFCKILCCSPPASLKISHMHSRKQPNRRSSLLPWPPMLMNSFKHCRTDTLPKSANEVADSQEASDKEFHWL